MRVLFKKPQKFFRVGGFCHGSVGSLETTIFFGRPWQNCLAIWGVFGDHPPCPKVSKCHFTRPKWRVGGSLGNTLQTSLEPPPINLLKLRCSLRGSTINYLVPEEIKNIFKDPSKGKKRQWRWQWAHSVTAIVLCLLISIFVTSTVIKSVWIFVKHKLCSSQRETK